MKKWFIGLLVLGLVAALGMPAFAADVRVSGEYFAAGYWESNRAMKSSDETAQRYYGQRLRVDPLIKVAEGLSLVTRFDAMERVWGQTPVGTAPATGESNSRNTAEEQNISWRRAYLSAKMLGGTLDVGLMGAGRTGTVFMNYDADVARIKYTYVTGPWQVQLVTEKAGEYSVSKGWSDSDKDKYAVTPVYKWSTGEVGTQLQWYRYNDKEQTSSAYRSNYYLLCPWFKTAFGPLYLEGEISYYFGKAYDYIDPATQDKDYDSLNYYLMAKYTAGPLYLGGQIATVAGNDPNKTDKVGAPSAPSGTIDYQPTLVLFNDWTNRWTGQSQGTTTGTYGSISNPYYVSNANLYQVFLGYKPMPKFDVSASFTLAKADQKPSSYVSDKFGNEVDIKAAYKIYDNLEYLVGFGYLWTGDYFKGTSSTNEVGNDWLLMHKLTLTF